MIMFDLIKEWLEINKYMNSPRNPKEPVDLWKVKRHEQLLDLEPYILLFLFIILLVIVIPIAHWYIPKY